MDTYLTEYLNSGRAWVLVGSGPSSQMGYPRWERFASIATDVVKSDGPRRRLGEIDAALKRGDYPQVFEIAKDIIGFPRLLEALRKQLIPSRSGRIYELITRWPVPVFLTTNYDDELQKQLTKVGASYQLYLNSRDHMDFLHSGLNAAIFKLHGDLRSESGLILTTAQYGEIEKSDQWEYWRVRMRTVFQWQSLIIIGHSLQDQNIRHILQAAKLGASVANPICWIAPDVPDEMRRQYLENYKIRVISYDNRDKQHTNLLQLLEKISDFVIPRTTIGIRQQIAKISQSPLENNAAAPGFFVFNKLSEQAEFEEKRVDIIAAAIQAALPKLSLASPFTLTEALEIAGWPRDTPLPLDMQQRVIQKAITTNLLRPEGDKFRIASEANRNAEEVRHFFEHSRNNFLDSLILRLRRDYSTLDELRAKQVAFGIHSSLTGYFREAGLTFATALFSSGSNSTNHTLPGSIIKFLTEAAAQYDDLLSRQAFIGASIDAFIRPESSEREYLGRLSQGFFAFHALGVFGDAAEQRLQRTKETIWLIDSSAQIPVLALAAPSNAVFRDLINRWHQMHIRVFTTEKLFRETCDHLFFAKDLVRANGADSPMVMYAALGQAPYRKSNQFLEGFIRWQAAGKPCDWDSYLFQIFRNANPCLEHVRATLEEMGIEVVAFSQWPGFKAENYGESLLYVDKITEFLEARQVAAGSIDTEQIVGFKQKADPEGEALVIISKERQGAYFMLSKKDDSSPAWFISSTSLLNAVAGGQRITWQPEAFLRFASTLVPTSDRDASDQAFEMLLWSLAQTGLSVLDETLVTRVFGGLIDQASLSLREMETKYDELLSAKYGEPFERVLSRIPNINRPLAAIQINQEILQAQEQRIKWAEAALEGANKRAEAAERKATQMEKENQKYQSIKSKTLERASKRRKKNKHPKRKR